MTGMRLTPEERESLVEGLRTPDGCWDSEECCWAAFNAMVPAVEAIVAARLATVEALIETLPRNEFGEQHYLAVEAAYANASGLIRAALHPDPSEASTDA